MSRELSLTGEKLTDGAFFEPDVFPDLDVRELVLSAPACPLVHPASGDLEPLGDFLNRQEFIHGFPPSRFLAGQRLGARCLRCVPTPGQLRPTNQRVPYRYRSRSA